MLHRCPTHPLSAVAHGELDVTTRRTLDVVPAVAIIEGDIFCFDGECATVGHCVPSIHREIDKNLLNLGRIDLDRAEIFVENHRQIDVFADKAYEGFLRKKNHFIEVDDFWSNDLSSGKGQQLCGDVAGAKGGFFNFPEVFYDGMLFCEAQFRQIHVSQNDAEHIVEIVCHNPRQDGPLFPFSVPA